jgi:hypothetical protein
MASPTFTPILQTAAEHPAVCSYLVGLVVTLAVLIGIALRRPRVFASVADELGVENRIDRRLLLGAVVVMLSAGWPITLTVLAVRGVRVACGRR